MSSATIGYLDTCLLVKAETVASFWDTDNLSLGLAFLFGLLAGALLTLACAKCNMKDFARLERLQKHLDVEGQYYSTTTTTTTTTLTADTQHLLAQADDGPGKKKKRLKKRLRGGKKNKVEDESLVPTTVITLDEPTKSGSANTESGKVKGLADVLMKGNGESMKAELTNQDLDAIDELDRELREESINTMVQMLRVMLNKSMIQGKLSEDQYKSLVDEMQTSVGNVIRTCQEEKAAEEDELERRYGKDPDKLESEKDKLNAKYGTQMNTMIKDEKEKLRKGMAKTTNLNDDEIEIMLAEYTDNMAEMEKRLSNERQRQAESLEERLQKRRQMAEMYAMDKEQAREEVQHHCQTYDNTLQTLVDDGKLMDRQKQELIEGYEDDLNRIQKKHEEQAQQQQLTLAEKLQARREERQRKLTEKQEQDREALLQSGESSTNTAEVMDEYHDLLQRQRQERDNLLAESDEIDAQEFKKLQKHIDAERREELQEEDEKLKEKLLAQSQLNEKDVARMMRLHEQQVEALQRDQADKKKQMKRQLQEKLEQRRQKQEEEALLRQNEAETMQETQNSTIKKVLESQIDMSDEAKDAIMREHQAQTVALNNQLEMSRLKQQKRLEQRLQARKAKVADLKQKQEDARLNKSKEREKIMANLQKEIDAEEKRLEEDKTVKVAELRRRLHEETQQLLQEQEKQLGLLIARLEVGAARRQELIKRQDRTLKELEEQMAGKVIEKAEEEGRPEENEELVDNLLAQHAAQVSQLSDTLEDEKARQQRAIRDRLEAKRLKKSQQVEQKVEKDAQKEWNENKQRGTGLATSILSQAMMEQRHKMAMKQLEKDMEMEMQRQCEELNREMEEELQKELEEQKKRFLASVAAISNISKNEVNELVQNAVADTGGNGKEAKKLAKEMREEIERAKTNLGADLQDDSYFQPYERSRGYNDEPPSRPTTGRRNKIKPKTTFRDNDYDDF